MAEGFLKSFDARLEVFSAGTHPAGQPNPYAVAAMKELGIDISGNKPKSVDIFLADPFDFVITVCDSARETCPVFTGKVKTRLHIGFDDPADAVGTSEEVMPVYRRIRDEIREGFHAFYLEKISPAMVCNCADDCCLPKKDNKARKIIFAIILLSAIWLIAFKLFNKPVPAAVKESCCPPVVTTGCDTTKNLTCDTTKGSTCCPK